MKIRGNTVGTNMKRPDFNQTDPKKSDYILNNPIPNVTSEDEGKFLRVVGGAWNAVEDAHAKDIAVRLHNVEQIVIGGGVTSVLELEHQYDTRVTADGSDIIDNQNTFVKRIEGASVASANILPLPENWYTSKTVNGVTFTINKETGEITVNGTASESGSFVFSPQIDITAGNYILDSNIGSNLMSDLYKDGAWNKSVSKSFTVEGSGSYKLTPYIIFSAGATFNNVVFRPYLQRGTTALPWNKPFKGLQMAKINKVVSVGHNLIPYPYKDKSFENRGLTFTVKDDGTVTVNGTATAGVNFHVRQHDGFNIPSGKFTLSGCPIGGSSTTYYIIASFDNNNTYAGDMCDYGSGVTKDFSNKAFTQANVVICIRQGAVCNNLVFKPMLNYGDIKPYDPYIESIYQLPQTVELGEYDYIDIEEGKIYRYTKKLDPATATITMGTVSGMGDMGFFVSLSVPPLMLPDSSGYFDYGYGVSSDFEWYVDEALYINNTFAVYNSQLMFRSDDCADVETFRAKLAAGKTIYRTAEPISVEDIEIPKSYKAWKGGTETIIGADGKMNEYAHPTITQEYFAKVGG